jgi:DNA modification methylase
METVCAPSHGAFGCIGTANPTFGRLVCPDLPAKNVTEPFSGEIAAGKNTYVYDAHTYHTKVPPAGVRRLIDYYTSPGQTVLDPFCGSGMTGIAAAEAGRKALLSDLSPAAVFIARNLNAPIDAGEYLRAVYRVLADSADLEEDLYNTRCRCCGSLVPMLYMVWSYGAICSSCHKEFLLWDVARQERASVKESKILSQFLCPYCRSLLRKRGLRRTDRYPVQVGYKCCGKGRKESVSDPDDHDRNQLRRIKVEGMPANLWYPTDPFPPGVNTRQPIAAGIRTIDQAYTPRALHAMAYLWSLASAWPEKNIREKLLFTLTSLYQRVTVFSEFRFWGGSGNTANYNVPFIMNEQNVFRAFLRKAHTIALYFRSAPDVPREVETSVQSACHLGQLPDRSVDYIFTDPPFGGNINYSEMNFLWESWLGLRTDVRDEAIINTVQRKGIAEYRVLLRQAFSEAHRVLKESAWMTVMFHNSSDSVWRALQGAISDVGFRVEGTQIFDKEHGTFKQFVSENAVGYDLALHCRKTSAVGNRTSASHNPFTTDAESFVRTRLEQDPDKYVVRYLHVDRGAELDCRRLYAEWLALSVRQGLVTIGFEEFRAVAERISATVKRDLNTGTLF